MNHLKKSHLIVIFSTILFIIVFGSLYLGAGVGLCEATPPNIFISAEEEKTKEACTGTYDWSYRGKRTLADSAHPINFEYNSDNIVSVTGKQRITIGTQKSKLDKKYDFTVEEIEVYKDGQLVKFESPDPSFLNGNLYLQAPPDDGEYIYTLRLNFKDRGTVIYGFVVRVDMLTYMLSEISKHKTQYVGDSIKVSALTQSLPVPDNYFKQQYISMKTAEKPYELTVYYEAKKGAFHSSEWTIASPDNLTYSNLRKNALVLFCMVDNLDKVTFAFRNSHSDGKLDTTKYDTFFRFSRASFQEQYGNLAVIGKNLDLLEEVLTGKIYEAPIDEQG